ncbi:CBS domain-containing protein [Streptomyces sp. HNM0645]|uniref:CBS domain-containing protein n=1 Tax=Streptomyces sp. HNM0645 TaxID=2782343 RepID=UPI0024B70C91|nr:CBS domain-containing protein [Streptomyces sp. HNM0645]MDI9888559.1 CBS domain-containing protein [Streptomyces sp. HNM0645]
MTQIQTPTRPARPAPHADEAEPHAWADMTVEVALAVMRGARTERLIVRDADGRGTGLVTLAQLTGFRATPDYTDRVQLRDLRTAGPPSRS